MMTIPSGFRPMLATSESINPDTYDKLPMYASYKLDGIRCIANHQDALSRTLKGIPNKEIRSKLPALLNHPLISKTVLFDGEIVTYNMLGERDDYNTVQSKIMTRDTKDFLWTYHIFDCVNLNWYNKATRAQPDFNLRLSMLQSLIELRLINPHFIQFVDQYKIKSRDDLHVCIDLAEDHKYEGLILRSPTSPYKFGRSTVNENYLMKVKKFIDGEALIIGMTELMHNENVSTTSGLGLTERSSHKSSQVAGGMMGALIVRDIKTGVEFEIGTGFIAAERKQAWFLRNSVPKYNWIGKTCKYKSQGFGVKLKPRSPVWLGFRDMNIDG